MTTTWKESHTMNKTIGRVVGGVTLAAILAVGSAGVVMADESEPSSARATEESEESVVGNDQGVAASADVSDAIEEVQVALDEALQETATAAQLSAELNLVPGGLINLLCGLIRGLPLLGDLLVPLLGCPEPEASEGGGGLLPGLELPGLPGLPGLPSLPLPSLPTPSLPSVPSVPAS